MVIEATFTDGNRAGPEAPSQLRDVASGIETSGVVRMDSGGREHEAGIFRGEAGSGFSRAQRLADTNDRPRARCPGARDYGVAVAGERRVREVGVAVDEDVRAPVLRGHLRSIQRRIGAAT